VIVSTGLKGVIWVGCKSCPDNVGVDTPSRVTTYVNRNCSDIKVAVRTDILEHPDIIILDISIADFSFLVINLYNDSKNSVIPALMNAKLPDLPTCITGDFNLHHDMWSAGDSAPSHSGKAEDLVDWMTLNGFTLLNQKGEVTFTRQKQTSVLDLTWLNDKALMDDQFQNWQIREDLDIGSDHLPVRWEVDLDGF